MISIPAAELTSTPTNPLVPHKALPCRAEREKFIQQARLILAAARAITHQSDRCFAPPSAEGPPEDTVVAA
jgi:hypothetical protein